ncbi:hypothetical protein CWI75_14755 [Kineobactrum sediminis]|uniref:RloB domain-containing protein n=1 Tax=Kineobactrum sediminis TaxID=1905677 RepID=A0A2N5XZZ9_9GAMM|nr:RloB family protein [Kineobactrum sediminis]PLW81716.1 hypothetical protein CWI75_14755 [Kineobactrum sediminis]
MAPKRKVPKSKSLRRRPPERTPKYEIYIFSEGSKTEVDYFEKFQKEVEASLVTLIIRGGQGDPQHLVKNAIEKKAELDTLSKRNRDSFSKRFQVWAVFDKDEHMHYDAAIMSAEGAGIHVARSNPCFELWGLLLLRAHAAPTTRFELQRILKTEMVGYDHDLNPHFVEGRTKDNYREAIDRADELLSMHVNAGSPYGNPCTTVHTLVHKIAAKGSTPLLRTLQRSP